MLMRTFNAVFVSLVVFAAVSTQPARSAPRLAPVDSAPRVWACSEFRIDGVPASGNPYDPDSIAVDVAFTSQSGRSITMPAFWFQPFRRSLKSLPGRPDPKTGATPLIPTETLTPDGEPGWRVRFTPLEAGRVRPTVIVALPGSTASTPQAPFEVAPSALNARGFVRVEPTAKRYFETSDGKPLPLIGECACWTHERGTYDYDDWLAHFRQAGMNYMRLWMYQTFAIDFFPYERLNYNQKHAWDLDYVLDEANRDGVYAMLCLDYHGLLQNKPGPPYAYYWPNSGYNSANGGPCADPGEFFTLPAAKALYRKRLRYLIARWGAEPSLMSWQLFNEVNQAYKTIKPEDIVAWHSEMAAWLHKNDPYGHLVTTSLGSAFEQPAMWALPDLDYTLYHWYWTWPGAYKQPAQMAVDVASRYHRAFGKPFYIAEFGTSGLDNSLSEDPYRRGLEQALWAGIMGGSAGTAMPWAWPTIETDNLYPLWGSLSRFLSGSGFGSAAWRPGAVDAPVETAALGAPDPSGAPFDETIKLSPSYAKQPPDPVTLRQSGDGDGAMLSGFVNGRSKPEFESPIKLSFRAGEGARLVMHLNSVADGAVLTVRSNGTEILRRELPNKDGKWDLNNEYNEDIDAPLPAGPQELEIANPGGDWFYLDWIRLSGLVPSRPTGAAALDAWTMTDGSTTLLWAVDPGFDWPRGAYAPARTVSNAHVDIRNLADGRYQVAWWDTRAGKQISTQAATSRGGHLVLPVIPFHVDIAARLTRLRQNQGWTSK